MDVTEHSVRMFKSWMLRQVCGFERKEVAEGQHNYIMGSFIICTCHHCVCCKACIMLSGP